jgi:hypothetical protein
MTKKSTENNLLDRKTGPVTLKGLKQLLLCVLSVGVVKILAQTVFPTSSKTNRVYLQELLDQQVMRQTATELVRKMSSQIPESEQRTVEKGLGDCMTLTAEKYIASDDPYLGQQADKATSKILAERFMKACGAIE